MIFNPVGQAARVQQHQDALRTEADHDRLAKIARGDRAGFSARQARARLGEDLYSVWIRFVCSWGAIRAGQAPGRC